MSLFFQDTVLTLTIQHPEEHQGSLLWLCYGLRPSNTKWTINDPALDTTSFLDTTEEYIVRIPGMRLQPGQLDMIVKREYPNLPIMHFFNTVRVSMLSSTA